MSWWGESGGFSHSRHRPDPVAGFLWRVLKRFFGRGSRGARERAARASRESTSCRCALDGHSHASASGAEPTTVRDTLHHPSIHTTSTYVYCGDAPRALKLRGVFHLTFLANAVTSIARVSSRPRSAGTTLQLLGIANSGDDSRQDCSVGGQKTADH